MAADEKTIDWGKWGPPIPGFSCLEMKWAAAEEIGTLLEAMSPAERQAYYAEANARFRARLESSKDAELVVKDGSQR